MRISTCVLPAFILVLATTASGQILIPGGGLPPMDPPALPEVVCDVVSGELEITVETDTEIEATFSGDVEGTLTGAITETTEAGILTFVRFEGEIATAGGNLSVEGLQLRIGLDPMGGTSLVIGRQVITGGDGDFADAFGVIAQFGLTGPMMSALSYIGLICTPAPSNEPQP